MALYLIIFAALVGLVGLILLIAPSIGAARLKYPFWRVFALFLLAMSSIGFIKGIGQAVSSCIPGSYTNVAAPLASSLTIFSGQGFPPRVTALEARNGALRWQHDLAPDNTEGTGQLTVSHNVVYVLGQEKTPHQEQPNFPNGGLTAYRASNGTMLWHVSLPGPDALSLSEMNEAPLLADGLVYVGTSASLGLTGRIYAFHTTDGTLAWSVLILHYLPDWQNRSLVAGGGLLFFSTLDGSAGQTMAFRAQDGRLIWQVPIGSMRPLLSEGILYLPNESGLQALRASDGKFLWTQPLNVGGFPSLSITDQHLYIGAYVFSNEGAEEEYLYALNALNGFMLWKYQVINIFPAGGVAVEANGVVYFAADRFLYALQAQNGNLIWKHEASPNAGFDTLVMVQHVLFVQAEIIFPHFTLSCPGNYEPSNALFALNATNGSIYWRSPANSIGGTGDAGFPLQVG